MKMTKLQLRSIIYIVVGLAAVIQTALIVGLVLNRDFFVLTLGGVVLILEGLSTLRQPGSRSQRLLNFTASSIAMAGFILFITVVNEPIVYQSTQMGVIFYISVAALARILLR